MNRIFKYKLEITDEQVVVLKPFAKPLSVQFQGPDLCLWAQVNDSHDDYRFRVRIIGTGHPMPDGMDEYTFLGTVQQFGGSLIWHVFIKPDHPAQ